VSDQFHAPAAFPPGGRMSNTHWIGGWQGLRAGLDVVVKKNSQPFPLSGIEPQPVV